MINKKSRQLFDRLNITFPSIQQAFDDSIVALATSLDADGVRRHSGNIYVNPGQAHELINGIKRNHELDNRGTNSAAQAQSYPRDKLCWDAHNHQAKGDPEDDQVVPTGRRRRTLAIGAKPPHNMPLPQLWDHVAWQKRIRDRLEQLGSPAQTLLRDVGGQSDEIRTQLNPKNKGSGPNINIVLRIAKALQWTIGQALGTEDPTLMPADGAASPEVGKRKGQIDPQKLQWALCFVDQYYIEATGSDNRYIEKSPGYAEAVNVIYSFLSEEESEGRSPDPEQNPTLRLAIRNLLRHL